MHIWDREKKMTHKILNMAHTALEVTSDAQHELAAILDNMTTF
jgi:hypothetical protein